MSADAVALIAGTILGVGALAFVLYPLFFSSARPDMPRGSEDASPEESAIAAIREIEFDRATGKLSDVDYRELRAAYTEKALRELRGAPDRIPGALDPIEARVRAYRMMHRECPACGLRPERDAVYCSTCGTFLDGACPACAAPIAESGATFCSTCGVSLSRTTDARRGARKGSSA